MKHHVRLLSWMPGRPLADTRPHSELLEPLGRFLGVLDRGLADFEHPAADREFYWDLRQGLDVAGRYASDIVDRDRRQRIEGFDGFDNVERWVRIVADRPATIRAYEKGAAIS